MIAVSSRRYKITLSLAVAWVLCFLYWQHSQRQKATVHFTFDEHVWIHRQRAFPRTNIQSLPSSIKGVKIPQIQAPGPKEDVEAKNLRLSRRAAVLESFEHSWKGYVDFAWGHDELMPVTNKFADPFGGWGVSLVDALDTLWLMGMKQEFKRAVKTAETMDFSKPSNKIINVYETTVRYLGGFLGAYELSGKQYPILLKKAIEVGDLLLCAFDTPNGLPLTRWDWERYAKGMKHEAHGSTLLSELGSLSLEFTKLSHLTGDMKYWDAVRRVSEYFQVAQRRTQLPGMWPIMVNATSASFNEGTEFTLGGMSDSVYEYLPKQYLMLGGQLETPRKMYETFIEVAKRKVFWEAITPWQSLAALSGDIKVVKSKGAVTKLEPNHQAQHLACFAGGMVGLASRIFDRPAELALASQLTEGCVWAYNATPSGIAPEIFRFVPCRNTVGGDITDDCQWTEGRWHKEVKAVHQAELNPPKTPPNTGKDSKEETVKEYVKRLRIPQGMTDVSDTQYWLRSEAIESVFVMYRLTGDASWMDKAWKMFERIEKMTRTGTAASAIDDVLQEEPKHADGMESYWMAETLKYFYLMFSKFDVVSLDEWVLNTEAHPLRRPDA